MFEAKTSFNKTYFVLLNYVLASKDTFVILLHLVILLLLNNFQQKEQ